MFGLLPLHAMKTLTEWRSLRCLYLGKRQRLFWNDLFRQTLLCRDGDISPLSLTLVYVVDVKRWRQLTCFSCGLARKMQNWGRRRTNKV